MERMRKIIPKLKALVFVTLILAGSGITNSNGAIFGKETITGKVVVKTDPAKSPQAKPGAKTSGYELLQGKWQNVEDKTNFIIFEKNHRKEISEGMEDWDDATYVLSDACMNESKKGSVLEKEKDRYISVPEDDLCCYILKLDATTLSISYMGRGNTFTYKKVK
jgi:hypothetical protein